MATAISAATLPGPRGLPGLGWRTNILSFLSDPIQYISEVYRTYGPVAALARGDGRAVFAFGPTFNQQLLTDPQLFFNTSLDLNAAGLRVPRDTAWYRTSTGLLTMNGPRHRQARRLMQPSFHRKYVERYRDEMVALTERMLGLWAHQPGEVRDIAREMRMLTLQIASQTLFGVDATRSANSVGYKVERWLRANSAPSVSLLPYNLPGSGYRRALRVADELETEIKAIIAEKRAQPDAHHDVLASLIAARDEDGAAMSDEELIGHATVLFLAGHETSANALGWTLVLLSQHPSVLADLVDELDAALGGAAPTVEQLPALVLLDRVVRESLRLLPPVSVSQRLATAPCELGGYQLPQHAAITWSPYLTHRLPELFAEPQRFWPARWEMLEPSPYAYLPFGAGPRMCIGMSFAWMEIKLVLAMLLQRFRFELAPNAKVDRSVTITLQPKYGLPMRVVPQDRRFGVQPLQGNIREMVDLQ